MLKQPKVSVLMPTFNRSEYLAEAIGSVRMQTMKDWELIIVDDGSTDSSYQLLAWYEKNHPNIHVFCNTKNEGISRSRNTAFSHAQGQYIAVMDSDDIMAPNRLELSLKTLKKEHVDVVYGAYLRANEDAVVIDGTTPVQTLTDIGVRNNELPPHVTVLAKRQCFEDHPYDPKYKVNDDQKLLQDWYLAGYSFAMIPEDPLMIVRFHTQSTSSTRDEEIRETQQTLKKEFDAKRGIK